jgi:TPR repeat protein
MQSPDELAKYYSTIGVRSGASLYEVKAAFRAISARSHPDNFEIGSADYLAAQEKQKALNQAYECLKRHLHAAGDTGKPPENPPTTAQSPAESMDDLYARALAVEKGQGQPADVLKAIDAYKKLALMGHAKSQFRLGLIYFDSVMKDVKQAHEWWKRAANNGHVGAMFNLGLMYERGYGAPKDDAEAFRWFKEAATRGDKQAREKLIASGAIKCAASPPASTTPVAAQKAGVDNPSANKNEAANESGLAKMFLKKRVTPA